MNPKIPMQPTHVWKQLDRRALEVISGTAKLEGWREVRRNIELGLRAP
jgi:hypothetical protein